MTRLNNDYDHWHTVRAIEDDTTASWHVFVKNSLRKRDVDGANVLEIGCGRGGFSNYLVNLPNPPRNLFACDYSLSAIEIGKQKYTDKQIKWRQEDIMAMTFDDDSFETAISCETIEHVPNPKKAICELYRVTKPGGRVLLTCPNYFNLFGIWCLYRWLIRKPYTEGGQPYVNYILMPRIYWWILSAGFKLERFSSLDIIVPARIPRHYYNNGTPWWLRIFGHRTFYILRK